MIFKREEKKGKYKKTTAAALAVMFGVSVVPFVDISTALASTNFVVTESEMEEMDRPSYDSVFQIPAEKIKSYMNNAGAYPNSPLSKMFDGDTTTHWETNKPNTSTFKNHVIVTFTEEVTLGSIVYYPRVQGAANKGFPTNYSIYASTKESGDDFTLVKEDSATIASDALKIKFDKETNFKRLKFVFDEAHQNWVAASELKFYKPDVLADRADALFTDGTMSELTKNVDLDEINQMLEQSKTHPNVYLTERLQIAKDILEGKNIAQEVFTVEQRGDGVFHARNILKTSSYGTNLLPTGIAALAGEQIKVYVEVEEGKPLPKITFSQQVGHWNNWQRTYNLKQGENVFTVPKIYSETWTHKVIAGGAIYIVNPYTPEQQGKAPRIRIEGGHNYPLFHDGDNVEVFIQELREYQEKLTAEPNKYVDIVELVNDYAIVNSNMTSALLFLNSPESTPQKTLDFHKERLGKFFAYAGISEQGDDIKHKRNGARANLRLMQPWAFAYAAGDHTGFQQGSANTLFGGSIYGWAEAHEIGHHFDIKGGFIGEVTNNMWANYNRMLQNETDRIADSYASIFTNQASDEYMDLTYSINDLGIWWQLHLLDENYWPNYQKAFRDGIAENMGLTKNERMAVVSSYALGMDITEHFKRNKFLDEVSVEKVKNALKTLEIPEAAENIKPWYMWTKATKDRESQFDQAYQPEIVSVTRKEGKVEIKVSIDAAAQDALLGYEVLQDGKVLGFTNTNTFISTINDDKETHTYQVRAFDLRSNATEYSEEVVADLSIPTISIIGSTIVPIHTSDLDLNSIVTAYDANGTVLNGVTVSGHVDTTKTGEYVVTYSVTDGNGKSINKDVKIHVVTSTEYLSDLIPTSAVVGWKTLTKDTGLNGRAIRLLQNGEEKTYTKGIGAHADSKVVYNVEGKNYEYFEAFIGIDGEVRQQSKPSATFEVWADGKKKYESGTMKVNTEQEYVKIDIQGAREIVLVTNGGGDTSSDHTIWADAKFSTTNSVPTIQARGGVFEGGTVVDLGSLATATDIEDGDLPVTFETDYTEGEFGKFNVTYTAIDKDGNQARKTVQIFVSNRTVYASDVDWESAVVGWGEVKKDKNIDGGTISLLVNGERTYFDKGIGAHANSTIIYNLDSMEEKPDYFSSYVGIDSSKPGGDVVFKVYADDRLIASTESQIPTKEAEFLTVDLSHVSKLKLVVESNGSISMDHAIWADSKFHFNQFENKIEDENLAVATQNINELKATLENVLNTEVIDVRDIEQIYVIQPIVPGFSGNETEKLVVSKMEELLGDKIKGIFCVNLWNFEQEGISRKYETIEEVLQNNLTITYQESNDKPMYILQNGQISQLETE